METRNTIRVNFVKIPSELKELVLEIPGGSRFSERHGLLPSLVTSGFDEEMMSVLFQFFDPEHHCFTFPNYQLVPTMEEFADVRPQNLPTLFLLFKFQIHMQSS